VGAWLDLITSFPTVLFAGLSAMSLLYWVLVIVGAADLDALDGLAGKANGLADGALDAVAGAAKGGTSAIGEALAALGLTKVPVTISATLFGLFGFFLSATTHHVLDPIIGNVLSALVATVVAIAGAGAATSVAVRPLRGLFADGSARQQGGSSLLGRTVTITIDADERSGQARSEDEVIVSVRSLSGVLPRGAEAVIMDRADDGVFIVEPVHAVLPSTADAFERLRVEAEQSNVEQHHPSTTPTAKR